MGEITLASLPFARLVRAQRPPVAALSDVKKRQEVFTLRCRKKFAVVCGKYLAIRIDRPDRESTRKLHRVVGSQTVDTRQTGCRLQRPAIDRDRNQWSELEIQVVLESLDQPGADLRVDVTHTGLAPKRRYDFDPHDLGDIHGSEAADPITAHLVGIDLDDGRTVSEDPHARSVMTMSDNGVPCPAKRRRRTNSSSSTRRVPGRSSEADTPAARSRCRIRWASDDSSSSEVASDRTREMYLFTLIPAAAAEWRTCSSNSSSTRQLT